MKKHAFIFISIMVVLGIVGALAKNSIGDLVSKEGDFSNFVLEQSHDNLFYGDKEAYFEKLDEALDSAEYIIKGTYAGERIPMYLCTLRSRGMSISISPRLPCTVFCE